MIREKIKDIWEKNKSLVGALALLSPLAGSIAYMKSHNIGSYRPEGLRDGMTSYVAYEFPDSTRLYMPAIPGMISGPIIDHGNDGEIDFVGTLTYPRMPVSINILGRGSEEQREMSRERYQEIFDRVMGEIRSSNR